MLLKMKNTINLSFINVLADRINSSNKLIQVVLGPRQVGKTTSVLRLIEDKFANNSIYVSGDELFNADSQWMTELWYRAQTENKILFIDEIQKIFNWSESIKFLYDQGVRNKKSIRCVLLGSSSLQIQKGLSESLTGRFQLIRAHHWNFEESNLLNKFTLDEFLKYGGYPGSYQLIKSNDWLDYVRNSIIATVVEKDILQFHTVKNPALFRQAFDIVTSYPAQEISYTKLLGQLQEKGNVEIIKYYLSLYEGAFLVKVLEKYSNKPHLKKSSSPKVLPLAPCLSYLQIRSEPNTEEQGRLFELIVGAQLVRTGEDLYYWRSGKFEVDYVLKVGKELWAIEVKSGRKKSRSGLEKFKIEFSNAKIAFIDRSNYFAFEKDPLKYLQENYL